MGKVHGSLTRAGKVKNATKFVRKTSSKKKLHGRIKFRKKYNIYKKQYIERRFKRRKKAVR